MKRRLSILAAGLLVASLASANIGRAAIQRDTVGPTAPTTYTVTIGWGEKGGGANVFSPRVTEIFVGDKVTWNAGSRTEPHTVAFGPTAMLDTIAASPITPMPQQAGPPLFVFNPKLALPTMGASYDGTGFVTSGLLSPMGAGGRTSWSLTFTKPGTYHYFCLIHYIVGPQGDKMTGIVVVNPRPAFSHHYTVFMGSKYDKVTDVNDSFNPHILTIHAGDSVTWIGAFHTVTFGPEAIIVALEKHFIVPVPQNAGPPLLTLNSKIALPTGQKTYDGVGFVNSGFLTPDAKGNPASYTLTFTKPGMYNYDCLVHYGMDGVINVLAAM